MRLVADIETDGLLRAKDGRPRMTKVHCVVTQDLDTGEVLRFWGGDQGWTRLAKKDPSIQGINFSNIQRVLNTQNGTIEDAIAHLSTADLVVWHNGIGFDIPALREFYGVNLWDADKVHDTIVLSHLMHPRIGDIDARKEGFPRQLIGRHSVEAWGWRIGHHKGEYAKQEHAFEELTPEMVDYCANDVAITAEVYRLLMSKGWSAESIRLEHRFAWRVARMMDNGFPFDMDAALALESRVQGELSMIDCRLRAEFGQRKVFWIGKTQPRDSSQYQQDEDGRWFQMEDVNLNARQQVAAVLQECYSWEPTEYTSSGQVKLDEDVIAAMPDDIRVKPDLLRRASLEGARKRLLGNEKKGGGLIPAAEQREDGSWWIHHYCNHNGARTGRCTHSHPNVNLPRVTSPWGPEFRGLVKAPPGWVIVGCDMSGVDARAIAHFLAPLDGGRMVQTVLSGSLHDDNREIMDEVVPGITRSTGKNVFYAVCYGAYPKRVGITAGVGPRQGGRLRAVIRKRVRGLDALIDGVGAKAKLQGYLTGIDGRILIPDAAFSALNTISQGAAAVWMKEATALVMERIEAAGIEAYLILHVHDEGQILTRPEHAETVGQMFVQAIKDAGKLWPRPSENNPEGGSRCPLDGEYKVGKTWAETH